VVPSPTQTWRAMAASLQFSEKIPRAAGIDGVAIAFALGAGGADTSHKPPSFKRVCPGAPAQEHRVQELTLSMRMSAAHTELALVPMESVLRLSDYSD